MVQHTSFYDRELPLTWISRSQYFSKSNVKNGARLSHSYYWTMDINRKWHAFYHIGSFPFQYPWV